MEPMSYEKRGYLNEDFRLFHLADNRMEPLSYHYHTFHKVIILLAGRTATPSRASATPCSPAISCWWEGAASTARRWKRTRSMSV